MHQVHRVRRSPEARIFAMPAGQYHETLFVESDGTENIVCYSGKHMPPVNIPRSGTPRWRTIGNPVVKP